MNAGLAKPILWYLVYSKADHIDVAQNQVLQVRALRANHGLFRRKSPAITDRLRLTLLQRTISRFG